MSTPLSFAQLVVGVLPHSKVKRVLLRSFGHRIDPTATIGPVLLWRVSRLQMSEGSVIRAFNVLRDLERVTLAQGASIGSWNWISAARPFLRTSKDAGALELETEAAVTSRHYVDCSGGVAVGAFAIVGGQRTTILTHSIDFRTSEQTAERVTIGRHSFVGTNSVVLKGASLPAASVLAAGSVLGRTRGDARSGLWVGNPATWGKALDGEFFTRAKGYVNVGARSGSGSSATSGPLDNGV